MLTTVKDSITMLVLIIVMLMVGGAAVYVYMHEVLLPSLPMGQPDFSAVPTPPPPSIPPTLKLVAGRPKEFGAETKGKRVMWLPLEPELTLLPIDSKRIWVMSDKAGTYRLVCWTAVNGLPTSNSLCIVSVDPSPSSEETKEEKK